jgi:hypothetical protein
MIGADVANAGRVRLAAAAQGARTGSRRVRGGRMNGRCAAGPRWQWYSPDFRLLSQPATLRPPGWAAATKILATKRARTRGGGGVDVVDGDGRRRSDD